MRLFESWQSLGQTLLAGVAAYVALVLFLRISGKRTLAKMNAFDLVVTVALGSTLASVITSDRLPLANGVLALALLILLQYAVAWLGVRSARVRHLVKSDPTLLFYDGGFLPDEMRRSRVNRDDVLAAVRNSGILRLGEVRAVVLETDGSLSVLPADPSTAEATSLRDVQPPVGELAARGVPTAPDRC